MQFSPSSDGMFDDFTQQREDHDEDEDEERKEKQERCNSIYASIDE